MKPTSPRFRKRLKISFILYLSTYALLSLFGEFVPIAYGYSWVKWYRWAPAGFVSGPIGMEQTTANRTLATIFYPLWIIDMKFIHTNDMAKSGKWPINQTLDDALKERTEKANNDLKKNESN